MNSIVTKVAATLLAGFATYWLLTQFKSTKKDQPPKDKKDKERSSECCQVSGDPYCSCAQETTQDYQIAIFYASQIGSTLKKALYFESYCKQLGIPATMYNLAEYEPEELFSLTSIAVFLVPSYDLEMSPCAEFTKWLDDARHDFRVGSAGLATLLFTVWAVGDSDYNEKFCETGRNIDRWLGSLGAQRIYPLGEEDIQEPTPSYEGWMKGVVDMIKGGNFEIVENEKEESEPEEEEFGSDNENVIDVEDIGKLATKITKAKKDKEQESKDDEVAAGPRKRLDGRI